MATIGITCNVYCFFRDNDKGSIKLRITHKGKRIDLYTGYTVYSYQWDKEHRRVKKGYKIGLKSYSEINADIENMQQAISSFIQNSYANSQIVSLTDIKDRFYSMFKTADDTKSDEFFFLFEQYIERTKTTKSWSNEYYQEWLRVKNSLKMFKSDISFSELSEQVMNNYLRYLSATMYNDKIIKNLQKIREFVSWAKKKKYLINEEFFTYSPKLKEAKNDVRFLSEEEVLSLINLDLRENLALDTVRDLFVFQCFTALRYSDLSKLRKTDVYYSKEDRRYYLEILTQKDKGVVNIPLSKYAEAIYLKYKSFHYPNNKMFPIISNQKYNDHLKELGKKADLKGVWKCYRFRLNEVEEESIPHANLSSHVPRRTFVSLALNAGASATLVASITSHADIEAMQPYIKITKEGKSMVIKTLEGLFK